MEKEISCSVCGNTVKESYCGNCGQQNKGKSITFISVVTDVFSNVLSLEKSVFAAIFSLIRNPRKIVHNYWDGNRKYYPSPGKLFFYSLAVAALHIAYIDKEVLGVSVDINDYRGHIFFWVLVFPFLTLSSLLTYIRREAVFIKVITSLLYIASAWFIVLTIIGDIINKIDESILGALAFPIFVILVFIWNAIAFDKSKTGWKVALNFLLQFIIFIGLIAGVLAILYYFSPESFNSGE